jgi:[methyl-Co(III) methanol-specific corrinoid protein]:coenzyme M methyltransferase
MNPRETILSLFHGSSTTHPPAFSGLIHMTAEGLQKEGLVFHEVHRDAQKMARAAASTYISTGFPSAVAPLDMYVEAEALGGMIDFARNRELVFPQIAKPLFSSTKYLSKGYFESTDFINQGRIPLVCEAIQLLKEEVGQDAVIGGMVPGPYTLLLMLIEPGGLFSEMKREPISVAEALFRLAAFLAEVGIAYRNAGADFITIHDMGGSPGFIGPAKYEQFAYPAEKLLITELPAPRVLSVCGNTNKSMQLLAQTGADAVAVDQLNDLAESRKILTDTLLLGNIDPVATLWQGDEKQVADAAEAAREAGVDAVWPGCDLAPQTPLENIRVLSKS